MRVWAIANQKGGVGKTTTTLALGRSLVLRGLSVLLVDLDPHASLTRAFGIPSDPQPAGVVDLFGAPPATLAGVMRPAPVEGLDFVCAQTIQLCLVAHLFIVDVDFRLATTSYLTIAHHQGQMGKHLRR